MNDNASVRIVSTMLSVFVLFAFVGSCKSKADTPANSSVSETDSAQKVELLPIFGYLDTRWGQSKAEVIDILERRGFKRAKKPTWEPNEYWVEATVLVHIDSLLDVSCWVAYFFIEDKLENVILFFDSEPEKRQEIEANLKSLIIEKYKKPQADTPSWTMWNTSGTIIELEHGVNIITSFTGDADSDEIRIQYYEKNSYFKKMEGLIKDTIKKGKEAKKKL